MNRILITGITGFVGATLVHYFRKKAEVTLYGHGRDANQIRSQYGDAVEVVPSLTTSALDSLSIDTIIHAAGIAHDLSNTYVEADYDKVNYRDTASLYDAFAASNARKFIYLSSIKAAVDHISMIADETVQPRPVTPYGQSKLKAERYIESKALPAHQRFYLLRPCMIHGAGNKGNLNLLYRFVKTGIPYPLGAFENRRSFLHADNLAFIIDELVHQPIPSGIYHLADDDSLSTNEVVRLIGEGLNRKVRIWHIPASVISIPFKLTGKSAMLGKLTENMEVSNLKIKQAMGKPLPVSSREGLLKTIRSFQ